jgi:hypothetical protein
MQDVSSGDKGKIEGLIEVTRRRGRRRKKMLDELEDRRRYFYLKEKALERIKWGNCLGRSKGDPVNKYSTRVNVEQETWKGRTEIKNIGGTQPLCQKKKVPTKDAIGGCRSGERSHLGGRSTRKNTYEIVGRKIASK